jgi:hypothetical protein
MSGGPLVDLVLMNCIISSKNNTYIYYFFSSLCFSQAGILI